MSLAGIAATLLREAGVTADDILAQAGVDRAGAVRNLAEQLGVDLSELVNPEDILDVDGNANLKKVSDEDVAAVRKAVAILDATFN